MDGQTAHNPPLPRAGQRILRRREAAMYLGISLRLFDEIRHLIPSVRYPGSRRVGYDVQDLDRFIEQNKAVLQ